MLLHDLPHRVQPEPVAIDAANDVATTVKLFKDQGQILGRNPHALIGNLHAGAVAASVVRCSTTIDTIPPFGL